jgi:ATP adenylyltransferase/5',5'''-P-1,P-4-tetraphosphate phosphorylase II
MIKGLFQAQLQDWPLVAKNYADLQQALWKSVSFEGFEIKIQFNPERIRSSTAKVDSRSVDQRRCFLCAGNRPPEQKGIDYPPAYMVLVNPYPIFPQHLTVADNRHVSQEIKGRMQDMLRLAQDFPDYVIVYNGPKCGASAPDHFHFQAGNRGFMPVEQDIHAFQGKKLIKQDLAGNIYYMRNYLRSCFIYESNREEWLISQFNRLTQLLQTLQSAADEPMLNLIVWKEENNWQLVVFPRKQHRPRQFYETGDNQLLLAPGVVDFGGILVVPRKEDYDKIDKNLLVDIFSQLTLSDEATQNICRHIVG